jgi:SAM-dependent methyltransferase
MNQDLSSIISQIRAQAPEFDRSYPAYKGAVADWRKRGLLRDEFVQGKTVLDWECGRGVFAALFLEMGARHVVGIDTWLDTDYSSQILSRLPNATFRKISIKEFRAVADCQFDLVFANTVTEHLVDLPQQLIACRDLIETNGLLFVNHDHYYQPVGSHDHGFLFYGENNLMVFQGPQCWSEPRKCEASEQFRQSIIQRFPWTWDEQIESLMDPKACNECPYYKRARPWAHLIYQDEFRRVFPQVCFTTGYEKSSLNKVTTFQLRQFIIEAGFDIESWIPNMIANEPPDFLTKPPYHFNPDELRTCTVTAVCRKSSAHCYQARLQDGKEEVP